METMNQDLRTCKICLFKVPHIQSGMYPNGREFRYVDASERLWSGKTCPKCHAEKTAKRAQEKKAAKQNEQNS